MAQVGFSVVFIIVGWLVLTIVADWLLFKKAKKPGWHSLIPFLNTYDEYDICWSGSMGVLYVILMLVYNSISQDPDNKVMVFFAGVVGIIMLIIHFMQSMKLARSFGKGRLYGVFLFFFGGIARIILGLGDAEYIGRVG